MVPNELETKNVINDSQTRIRIRVCLLRRSGTCWPFAYRTEMFKANKPNGIKQKSFGILIACLNRSAKWVQFVLIGFGFSGCGFVTLWVSQDVKTPKKRHFCSLTPCL